MRERIDKILAQYGSEMLLAQADGERTVRAFLQPVTASSREVVRKAVGHLGELPGGRWVYIGPADAPLREEDRIVLRGERFRVRQAELLVVAEEALYVWALLQKDGGEAAWMS